MGSINWKNLPPHDAIPDDPRESMPAHQVLGVPPEATPDEIKSAYRRKMHAYHPDRACEFLRRHNGRIAQIMNRAYRQLKGTRP